MCFPEVYGDSGNCGIFLPYCSGQCFLKYGPWKPWVSPQALSGGPWSWPHAQVWIIIVCHISSKSCVCEKKWFSCHLKCTSAFSWDNYSMCSRSALWILPILMHWLLERCLLKGQGEISGDTKKCSCLIFYEKMC